MREYLLILGAAGLGIANFAEKGILSPTGRSEPFGVERTISAPAATELEAVLQALDLYERAPTGEHAADAWEAFTAIDLHLAALRTTVAETVAGARAEAEIDRIELQSFRDREMARFLGSQRRLGAALVALKSIADSLRVGEWQCAANRGESRIGAVD